MARIIQTIHPFEPAEETRRDEHPGGLTIREWLEFRYPGFQEFNRPTICLINGKAACRAEWLVYRIQPNDTILFITQPGFNVLLIAFYVLMVASVVYSVYMLATMPKPTTPGQTPEADPTYDLRGQTNQIRLSSPIEVPYGRCRLWPSYAARPYNKFINNDQYQYSLYSLGQGTYSIESVSIEDTPISNFQDVEYEIYRPGQEVTLFPDNVITSIEVGGIELLGTNEAGYGYAGPFVANPTLTVSNRIEVDVVFPQGLYVAKDDGTLDIETIQLEFDIRKIDDAGSPLGAWESLFSISKTLKTNTPQRFTLESQVPPARYEIRGRRTNTKNTDAKAANIAQWLSLRSFLPSTKNYGNVTLIALKARATNNLNDRSSARLNLIATRELRKYSGGVWGAPVATRSLVWAFCDVFQASYGGRLADKFMNLEELEELDEYFETNGIYFDFVFDQRLTTWEAAKVIARVGRAVPMLNGSSITMVRDKLKTIPSAVFNPDCIVEGSFSWEIKLANVDEFDGLEIEYTNADSWKPETIKCLLDGEAGNYCEQVKLPGCTDRTRAWREGMYMRAVRKYVRENVKFKTGMEGNMVTYADFIGVNHDLPEWAQGGLVVAKSGTTLTLSEPVTFGSGTHVIGLRNKLGGVSGPHVVTVGADAREVILDDDITDSDFVFDDVNERPMFLFGSTTSWAKFCTVVGVTPADDGTIEIQSIGAVAKVFDNDDNFPADAPIIPAPPPVPDLPTITGLLVSPAANVPLTAIASWNKAIGAKTYIVRISYNGTDFEQLAVTTSNYLEFTALESEIWIQVSGVNVGEGEFAEWTGDISPVPPGGDGTDIITGGADYTDL